MEGTNINTWLRRAMVAAGYDVAPRSGGRAELARKAGVSLPTVNRLLDEPKVRPTLDILRKIGAVLGYSLGDVLIQTGLAEPSELTNSGSSDLPRLDPGEQRILEHPGLDEETRYAVLARYRRIRDEAIALALQGADEAPPTGRHAAG